MTAPSSADAVPLARDRISPAVRELAQVLRLLELGAGADALIVPAAAADWARSLVRRGIAMTALPRAYRLGHAWFWDRWSQALSDRLAGTDGMVAAQDESSAFMFAYSGA